MTAASPVLTAALDDLSRASFVAHREALTVLPDIVRHGEAVTLAWLAAVRHIFEADREAGKAFIRGSVAAEASAESVLPWTEQALAIARVPAAIGALEGYMVNVPRAIGMLGHAGERRWAEIGLVWCMRHPESGRQYFATPVGELAYRQGITGIEQLFTPIEELFESRKLLPATYLAGAIRVRNLLGAQAVLPWAARGADILQAGRARGDAYFRLESEESLQLLLDQLPGFRLAERSHLLTLLADLWFESDFEIKESAWSPEKGRPFVETDGRTVLVPAVMRDADEAIVAVLHTAGHLRFGTYDRDALTSLFAEAGSQLPPAGPVSLAPLLTRFGDGSWRFQALFDLCEDLRVDAQVQSVVPNHLTRMARLGELHRAAGHSPYYDFALASVNGARGAVPLDPRLAGVLAAGATIADAWRTAIELYASEEFPPMLDMEAFHASYLPGRAPNIGRPVHATQQQKTAEQPTQPGESEQEAEPEQGDESGDAPEQAQGGGEQSGEEKLEAASEGSGTGARMEESGGKSARKREDSAQEKGEPYPEWDYRENRYKRNWAWVQEKPLAESNLSEANRLTKQHSAALKRLKKAIQAQKPTRLAPQLRQFDGDDIDLDAAVSFIAERRAGMSPKPWIYRRREVRQREVAVTLLADMSTSIMQHLPEGGGRLVDRVRAGVLLFAESMEEVGDAYSIAGFCSKYRDNVSYYLMKDFDDPYTEEVRSVIGGISGRLATRMGAAIRHATARFSGVQSTRRLLLILSDGRPEDYDDGGDRRYLHEDTRMAVKEAVSQGVHAFCITVDTMANQYLPQIFGPGHYLVLDHINSLPKKLPEIYLRLRR
jgi:hypothetical protein